MSLNILAIKNRTDIGSQLGLRFLDLPHLRPQDQRPFRRDLLPRCRRRLDARRCLLQHRNWRLHDCWKLPNCESKSSILHIKTVLIVPQAAGALLFVVSILGWWIVVAMMAAEMRIGINIPIGDLSHFWADTKAAEAVHDVEKQE